MIKIPPIDLDSSMLLFKIYNPLIYQDIAKSLIYQTEGNNLAITKDNKYATVLSESDFIKCILTQGHFCI